MSGPVFVLDAQGIPLMPMGSAHARVLLGRGDAQPISYFPFTVLRLMRTVVEPVLRPIVIGISISQSITELFIVSSSPRAVRPLLYIIVDFHSALYSSTSENSDSKHTRDCASKPAIAQSVLYSSSEQQVIAIIRIIEALRQFLPLSHMTLLPAREPNPLERVELDYGISLSSHLLATHLLPYVRDLGLIFFDVAPLVQTGVLMDVPNLAAFVTAFYERPTISSSTLIAVPRASLPTPIAVIAHRNTVGSMIHKGHRVSGLVIRRKDSFSQQPVLCIPVSIAPNGIVWQQLQLDSTFHLLQCNTDDTVFLPLLR